MPLYASEPLSPSNRKYAGVETVTAPAPSRPTVSSARPANRKLSWNGLIRPTWSASCQVTDFAAAPSAVSLQLWLGTVVPELVMTFPVSVHHCVLTVDFW